MTRLKHRKKKLKKNDVGNNHARYYIKKETRNTFTREVTRFSWWHWFTFCFKKNLNPAWSYILNAFLSIIFRARINSMLQLIIEKYAFNDVIWTNASGDRGSHYSGIATRQCNHLLFLLILKIIFFLSKMVTKRMEMFRIKSKEKQVVNETRCEWADWKVNKTRIKDR